MGKRGAASEQRLDDLYRVQPENFIARRNELVKELREAGDRAGAERLKKHRRPTPAAWLINRMALDSPELLEEVAAAARAVEDAQVRVLEGDEEATEEWRSAAARERDASAAVREAAERTARGASRPVSPRAVEMVVETLRAASGDRELRDRVMNGRLEREQTGASFGLPAAPPTSRRKATPTKRREEAQLRREKERLEGALAKAMAREERLRVRVEEAAEAMRREKAKLADAKRETTTLKRKLKAVE